MDEVDSLVFLDLVGKAWIWLNEKEVVGIGCRDVVLLIVNSNFPQFCGVQSAAEAPFSLLKEVKVESETNISSLAGTAVLLDGKIIADSLNFFLLIVHDLQVSLIVEAELVAVLDVGRELHASRDITELCHWRGKFRVWQRRVDHRSPVPERKNLVAGGFSIYDSEIADLVNSVWARVGSVGHIRLEAFYVIPDWSRHLRKTEVISVEVRSSVDLVSDIVFETVKHILNFDSFVGSSEDILLDHISENCDVAIDFFHVYTPSVHVNLQHRGILLVVGDEEGLPIVEAAHSLSIVALADECLCSRPRDILPIFFKRCTEIGVFDGHSQSTVG